jgi:hypothetical protein
MVISMVDKQRGVLLEHRVATAATLVLERLLAALSRSAHRSELAIDVRGPPTPFGCAAPWVDTRDMSQVLRVDGGREVHLGSEEAVAAAWQDIMGATGGSSAGGQFSRLFGLRGDDALHADEAARLGEEASEFKLRFADRLRAETVALLDRLGELQQPADAT